MTELEQWEKAHERGWGRWPNTRFVEWAMRRYGNAPDRAKVRFLELGCGAGAQVNFLAAEGFDATGYDWSEAAIEAARDKAPRNGALAGFRRGDITMVRMPEQYIDCIVDICTLQHLDPVEAATVLWRARQWLKTGGAIFSMWAAVDTSSRAVPSPHVLKDRKDVSRMFQAYGSRTVGFEHVQWRRRSAQHWIIEATP